MKRKSIVVGILAAVLFSGCASNSGPTKNVGIINGKYAMQISVPNNNKGKKVNLAAGQTYNCKSEAKDKYTFDLTVSENGQNIVWDNDKMNGKTRDSYYIRRLTWKKGVGFVETTQGKSIIVPSGNNSGVINTFNSENDRKKYFNILKRFQDGKLTKGEGELELKKANIKGYESTCTQATNNTITHTRYLTNHEIDAYKHGQQIAVQQRAIDRQNYNATMDRLQAQIEQNNYNTQQSLNRMNTYKVKVY